MPTPTACRVCGGRLELIQRGSSSGYKPSDFSPSYHRAGVHGDLYRCEGCGTVLQPALPRGSELHELYRAMCDERVLREDDGRRRMARKLLDLLGEHVPQGRLLDIGCGYGLLLDEARRRGYEVQGMELSADAVRHTRERLGLSVRETAFEDAAFDDERYDAVLAVDVLEHFDDPVAALDRLCALLAPGGALLIVTPDPTSRVARMAGRRWWCYQPAHACLIPRKTLYGLLDARGFELVEDVGSVQSFTLSYWLSCLSERFGSTAGRAIAHVASRLPQRITLTASLGDERVLLARHAKVGVPAHR